VPVLPSLTLGQFACGRIPSDFTEDVSDNDYTIQCVIQLEQERLGRKLSQAEIQKIIDSYTIPEENPNS
jgi:hypothetical protein